MNVMSLLTAGLQYSVFMQYRHRGEADDWEGQRQTELDVREKLKEWEIKGAGETFYT